MATLYSTLFVVFLFLVLLKQTHVLAWSWWWISLPLWLVPTGGGLLLIVVSLLSLWHELKRAHRIRKYKAR
ncbi:hypothetical protein GO755_36170 [Spirosoma sp. HMF4905]|uniref:Transmembrane Fragile-X-F protein n=2 Tax=Spirosoma arboris TaxID=2682092 RepID=A0A7K1SNX7_9BACT|nr:hypothetical protein [Spirosoma arboris]